MDGSAVEKASLTTTGRPACRTYVFGPNAVKVSALANGTATLRKATNMSEARVSTAVFLAETYGQFAGQKSRQTGIAYRANGRAILVAE